MSPKQRALHEALDNFLYEQWDPIGVSGAPQARDEYRAYLPHVFSLAVTNASEDEIAAYLQEIISDRMSLSCSFESQLSFARKIKNMVQEMLA